MVRLRTGFDNANLLTESHHACLLSQNRRSAQILTQELDQFSGAGQILYEGAAPVPNEMPSTDAKLFLFELRELIAQSVITGGGELRGRSSK